MTTPLFSNPSWAHGRWYLEYDKDKDRFIIKTEYGQLVGEIGPTLVAHWIVEVHNAGMSK